MISSAFEEYQRWHSLVKTVDYCNKEALIASCQEAYATMRLYGISPQKLEGFEQEGVVLFRQLLRRFLQKETATLPPLAKQIPQNGGKISAHILECPNPVTEFLQALKQIEQLWRADPSRTFALVVHPQDLPWKQIHRLLKTHPSTMQISCAKGKCLADQPKLLFLQDLFASVKTNDLRLLSRVLISPFWSDDLERRAKLDVWMREALLRQITLPRLLEKLLFRDPEIQVTQWFQTWSKLAGFKQTDVEAFAELLWAAALYIFESRPQNSNLQIVSVLEAVEVSVDCIWLLSADSEHYSLQQGNSFLPQALLPKGENGILEAITAGCEVYASVVPMRKGEKRNLNGLIEPLSWRTYSQALRKNQDKMGGDEQVEALPALEISGGSQLLKEQAACPFKAFAHFRLKLRALGEGRPLLDPMQKGLLIHAALEKIWNELKSQQALLALDEFERHALVARKVDAVLFAGQDPLLKRLERERLIRILTDWLALEALRPPFAVEACELKNLVNLGGVQLRLCLDRVDQVGESRLIIDYKTGDVSSKDWFGDRLREPQLPLYVVSSQAEGAVFASLKVGKMGYAGVVQNPENQFAEVKYLENWSAQTKKWQSQLETLAQEFCAGRAEVAPIDEQACQYCDLTAFCRIKALQNAGL